jgi:rsbT antagonist protein RsbS
VSSELTRIPIIKLWNVLLIPLQGEITDSLSEQLSHDVLERIQALGSRCLVVDLTGLWMLDSHLCAVLTRMAQAAALMGTRTILCGMSPEIAMTLQTMGVETRAAETALSLEDALEALGIAGAHITEAHASSDEWSLDT